MIDQIMKDVNPCPICKGLLHPHDVRFWHIDDPAPSENFLWAYQEKAQDTIEVLYRCPCGWRADRITMFADRDGSLIISPIQTAHLTVSRTQLDLVVARIGALLSTHYEVYEGEAWTHHLDDLETLRDDISAIGTDE